MTNSIGLDQEEPKALRRFPDSYRQHKARFDPDELSATLETFASEDNSSSERSLLALQNCSSFAWFVRHADTGEVRVHSSKCRQRWCPICSQTLANWRKMALVDYVSSLDRPKFVTLTLKHSNAPLRHQINALYDAFRNLRKLQLLKKTIQGGIWFFQVKQAKSDGCWHPHLHIVVDSSYLPKNQLSRAWLLITHTSKIVDIRLIRDVNQTAKYVARYSARPAALAPLSHLHRQELVAAMAGRRLCGTWGTARRIPLKPPHCVDPEKWINLGNWSLVINCQSASAAARSIVRAWVTASPLPQDCTLAGIESEIDHFSLSDLPESFQDSIPTERSPPWCQLTLSDFVELYETPRSALASFDKPQKSSL